MTPEERAVIEAAERWATERNIVAVTFPATRNADPTAAVLHDSVRALRESRKPKPRWHLIAGDAISDGTNVLRMEKWERSGVLDDIMAALNERLGSDQK